MGTSYNIKSRTLLNHRTQCTQTHRVGALILIAATHLMSRAFDRISAPGYTVGINQVGRSSDVGLQFNGGYPVWPQRGYGSSIDLKLYVYNENEINGLRPLMYGRDGSIDVGICYEGQWGTQVKIHRLLLNSRFRTRKKEEADLFFVPTYVKCVHMMEGLTDEEINQTFVEVLSQMPYFRRSGGRDHIFVFPSVNGAHFFTSLATFLNRSIFLTPEGDQTRNKNSSAFNTWKDIIIPGNVDDGVTNPAAPLVQPLPLSQRKYLANYLGHAQGLPGRLQLLDLAKQYPDKLEAPDLKLDPSGMFVKQEYFEHLRNAMFCLAPRGLSSWTLRFFESFFMECVPVILSDKIELPFQNVIDYTQMTIKWPATNIGSQLLEYLESIPDESIERMIARSRRVKCLFVYAPESEPCSAIHGILWELQRKIRRLQQSFETFWLHNGTIVNRNLVEFHNWKSSMPLP